MNTNPHIPLFSGPLSVEAEAEYKKLMIVEEILKLMEDQSINRSGLARLMGVQPSRITSMLTGSNNFTIETLVRAGRALDAELHLHFAPDGHMAHWGTCRADEIHKAFTIKPTPMIRTSIEFELGPSADEDQTAAA